MVSVGRGRSSVGSNTMFRFFGVILLFCFIFTILGRVRGYKSYVSRFLDVVFLDFGSVGFYLRRCFSRYRSVV